MGKDRTPEYSGNFTNGQFHANDNRPDINTRQIIENNGRKSHRIVGIHGTMPKGPVDPEVIRADILAVKPLPKGKLPRRVAL